MTVDYMKEQVALELRKKAINDELMRYGSLCQTYGENRHKRTYRRREADIFDLARIVESQDTLKKLIGLYG